MPPLTDDAPPAENSRIRGIGRPSPDVAAPEAEEVDGREVEGALEVRGGGSSTVPVVVARAGESTIMAPLADVTR